MGVGKDDMRLELRGGRELLARRGEARPKEHLMGVLWTTALPADIQDCGLCVRENFGVVPSGEPPIEDLGILNGFVGVSITFVAEFRWESRLLILPVLFS